MMFTSNELEVGNFDGIVIDDAAKKQTAMFFPLVEAPILEILRKHFDEIQR